MRFRPIAKWTVTSTAGCSVDGNKSNNDAETPIIRERISEVDEMVASGSNWIGITYRFDAILDADAVRGGLVKTIDRVPAIEGRLDVTTDPLCYQLVLHRPDGDDGGKNRGVELIVEEGRTSAGNDDDDDAGSGGGESTTTTTLPTIGSTRDELIRSGLAAPPSPSGTELPGPTDPLFRARLVLFREENVSFLGIGFNHVIGDGHTMTDIIRIWSHFCSSYSSEEESRSEPDLPPDLAASREMGHRVTNPLRPVADTRELHRRWPGVLGLNVPSPLSPCAYWRAVLGYIWNNTRDVGLELRVDNAALMDLKKEVTEALPPDPGGGERPWVSRFEVLFASLLCADAAACGRGGKGSTTTQMRRVHVAVDLRGRDPRFPPKGYVGNGTFDATIDVAVSVPSAECCSNDGGRDMAALVATATSLHKELRTMLSSDPYNLVKHKDWLEAARHIGLRNARGLWIPFHDAQLDRGVFLNSWTSLPWTDVSMGAPYRATCMFTTLPPMRNLWVETPHDATTGDSVIRIALAPNVARRFCDVVQTQQFPFRVVE